jgi:ABC-type Fe3+ transport system permease subunit
MDTTSAILLVVVIGLLAWEVVTLRSSSDSYITISAAVDRVTRKHRWIVLLLGVLLGHWFWPFCPPCG